MKCLKNTREIKEEKAITLIVLTITIIILLILVGISIAALTQTGVFKRINQAKQKSEDAQGLENKTLVSLENDINAVIGTRQNENSIKILSKLEETDDIKNFSYTGDSQEFTAEQEGYYKIECWGAGGYNDIRSEAIGYGGYATGVIHLNKNEKLYIYVGGHPTTWTKGGYNGGGYTTNPYNNNNGAGGGATDIRLNNGEWNNFESLKSRIMVAAGGGGGCAPVVTKGDAGTLKSKKSTNQGNQEGGIGADQTSGFSFGIGESGTRSAGGGGYYGGIVANGWGSGCGGSSYISGHLGCNSIAENSEQNNIIHTGSMIHYSGKYFLYTQMEPGYSYMPTFDNKNEMVGNSGNGYAKITKMNAETY